MRPLTGRTYLSRRGRPGSVKLLAGLGYQEWDGIAAIDAKEGYGWAYTRVMLPVRLETNGSQHVAIAYTVIRKQPKEVPPSRSYLGRIIEAAHERGLPPSCVERLVAIRTAEDT